VNAGGGSAPGAQTVCRGDAGPVSDLLGGKDSPAIFFGDVSSASPRSAPWLKLKNVPTTKYDLDEAKAIQRVIADCQSPIAE
jgi:hypothetical protein